MYWTDTSKGTIERSNSNGTSRETAAAQGFGNPSGIVVDSEDGFLYWADYSPYSIIRTNLDDSGRIVLINTEPSGDVRLALDKAGNKIYWTNRSTDKIRRANLDGTNEEDFLTDLLSVKTVALAEGVSPVISTQPPTRILLSVDAEYAYDADAIGYPAPTYSLLNAPGGDDDRGRNWGCFLATNISRSF